MSDFPEVGSLLDQANELIEAGEDARADAIYQRILDFDPAHKQARLRRIMIARRHGTREQVLALIEEGARTDPSNPQWLVGRALAQTELNRHEDAIQSYDAAIALQEDYADAWFGKAQLLLLLGRYKEGWELYEWRFYTSAAPAETRIFRQPMWDGHGFHGKMMLIHAEQGLGDTIQFYRFVMQARSFGGVIVEAPPQLVRLFASQPQAPLVRARGEPLPLFDLQCSMMSLPLVLGNELHSVPSAPYLRADPALRSVWADRLPPRDGRPRIGISWASSAAGVEVLSKTMPLRLLLDTLGSAAVIVSLQLEMPETDVPVLREATHVVDLAAALTDFADTAAVVSELDLVISVDTAVAHLAGAMGQPVWILLPEVADWRWLYQRADSPWYPTARLFRQTAADDWGSVMPAVGTALRALAAR